MTDDELHALHARWLKDIRKRNYDKRYTLNLWFSTVAELQGMDSSTDEMWSDARAIRAIFDSLMLVVENEHERGGKR